MENNEKLGNNPKKRSLKTKIVAPALAWVLMLSWTAATGQWSRIEDERVNKKEIVVNSIEEKSSDTTIDYNTAKTINKNKTEEVSTEEIKEFIINNKEEILGNINDITREKIYNELISNIEIFKIVRKLTHDEEIRDAALNWNNKLIQERVDKEIRKIKRLNPDSFTIASITLTIWILVWYLICKKADKDYEKEKEKEKEKEEQNQRSME